MYHGELEQAEYRIGQLENALAELLVEIKSSTNPISGRVTRAWTNANQILNEGKP